MNYAITVALGFLIGGATGGILTFCIIYARTDILERNGNNE